VIYQYIAATHPVRTTCLRGKVLASLFLLLAGFLLPTASAQAQNQTPAASTPAEVENIEQIVRDYLLRHPEVLVEALTLFEQRRDEAAAAAQQAAVSGQRDALENDPDSPVAGNRDGDVVLIEFFDYRCPYCRKAADTLDAVMKADGNLRIVFKEFPILGPESVEGAKAALAAAKQDKYEAFHFALMREPGDMSAAHLRRTAEEVGMDADQMERDMRSSDVTAALHRNYALAESLSIRGTPAFVVGGTLVPGAVDASELQRLIAEARAKAS
jgi:protein-disulfide isomerase